MLESVSVMKKFLLLSLLACFTVFSAGVASAATINIYQSSGTKIRSSAGVGESTATEGRHLAGSLVTVTYADGTTEDLVWRRVGRYSLGGAYGSDITISQNGGPMVIDARKTVSAIYIDLAPSNTIFDIVDTRGNPDPTASTPSTSFGTPFSIERGGDGLTGQIDVTYSGIVNIAGHAAVGDIYTRMLVDFSGLTSGGFLGRMRIEGDTDSLADNAVMSVVPLPAGLPLLIAGLAMFGFMRSRRKAALAIA